MGNKVAVLMRKAPYGSVYTAEGFRSMMPGFTRPMHAAWR